MVTQAEQAAGQAAAEGDAEESESSEEEDSEDKSASESSADEAPVAVPDGTQVRRSGTRAPSHQLIMVHQVTMRFGSPKVILVQAQVSQNLRVQVLAI